MTDIKTDSGVWLDISPDAEFELTIENPLFRDDRCPSSWSTDISFPPTTLNKKVFGYLGALMTEPSVKKLGASIVSGGLGLFTGTLEYDSIDENGNLIYTFSGKNLDDDWGVKIYELQGLRYDDDSGYGTHSAFLAALKDGEVNNIHLPLVINESLTGETSCGSHIYLGDSGHTGSDSGRPGSTGENFRLSTSDWGNLDMKYRNSPGAYSLIFTVPAVDISYFIEAALGENGAGDLSAELSKLVIFATWWIGFPAESSEWAFVYDVAAALPDISLRDLVKSVCSMFCAAVFSDHGRLRIHSAKAIMAGEDVEDWTDKVNDVFTSEAESPAGYELSYNGSSEEASGVLETDGEVDSLAALLALNSEEYEAVEHTTLKDIYSVKTVGVDVTISGISGRPPSVQSITEFLCDRLNEPAPAAAGADLEDQMSVQIGFRLAGCVPARHYWYAKGYGINETEKMAAVLSLPSVESERPGQAFIAVLHQDQASDKGVVIGAAGDESSGLDITPSALFDVYHRTFAEWVVGDRQRLSVDLNMSVYEAANFKMWRKVRILGRAYLVETLTIRFRADSDDAEISADLLGL